MLINILYVEQKGYLINIFLFNHDLISYLTIYQYYEEIL
jgi:hypothetical protein